MGRKRLGRTAGAAMAALALTMGVLAVGERARAAGTSNAPFAPRRTILWDKHLFAADVTSAPGDPRVPGAVPKHALSGKFVAARPSATLPSGALPFHPASGRLIGMFVSNAGSATRDRTNQLHGPEGIVFGPDGRLHVTSRRVNEEDSDTIPVIEGPRSARPGARVGKTDPGTLAYRE